MQTGDVRFQRLIHSDDRREWDVHIRPSKLIGERPEKWPKYFEPDSLQWWRKGVQPRRDSFRERCYEAERAYAAQITQQSFANITEAAIYLRDFIERPWFQRRFPFFRSCQLVHTKGARSCYGSATRVTRFGQEVHVVAGFISMSSWGLGIKAKTGGEVTLLHELAHAVLPNTHQHDRRWVRTFTEFVGCARGQDEKKQLLNEFRARRVPYSPIKRVHFTEEQCLQLAASRPKR